MGITDDSSDNDSFRMDNSLEYLNLSHFSITSNGLSIEEETIENLLGVPYQFDPEFDSDDPENHIDGG